MATSEDVPPRLDPSASAVAWLCTAALHRLRPVGIEGLAVSRCVDGRYAGVVHASDDVAEALETLQETVGEGPGPSAWHYRSPVLVRDLAEDLSANGWAGFVRVAEELAVRAVFALPVQVGAVGLGLLTAYGLRPVLPDPGPMSELLRLGDAVALALLSPGDLATSAVDGLADILDVSHAVTQQAVGMVSVQLATTLETALVVLRAHAYGQDQPLVEVARAVVTRRLRFGEQRDGPGWWADDRTVGDTEGRGDDGPD